MPRQTERSESPPEYRENTTSGSSAAGRDFNVFQTHTQEAQQQPPAYGQAGLPNYGNVRPDILTPGRQNQQWQSIETVLDQQRQHNQSNSDRR